MSMQAQDRKTASASLQIAVVVVPTVIGAQIADRRVPQPTLASVAYRFQSDIKTPVTYSVRDYVIAGPTGRQTAVLKTSTVLPE